MFLLSLAASVDNWAGWAESSLRPRPTRGVCVGRKSGLRLIARGMSATGLVIDGSRIPAAGKETVGSVVSSRELRAEVKINANSSITE